MKKSEELKNYMEEHDFTDADVHVILVVGAYQEKGMTVDSDDIFDLINKRVPNEFTKEQIQESLDKLEEREILRTKDVLQ